MLRWIVIIAVPLVAISIPYVIQQFKPKVKTPIELNPQYDYIIIGGGTAGNVLAARLSEDGKTSVLLLEAGGEESELFYSHIPGAAPFLQSTDFDWAYETQVQEHCCNMLNEKRVKWPRGKVLGGSSVLHFAHFARGHRADFEAWKNFLASNNNNNSDDDNTATDWSYNRGVEPYFKILESVDFNSVSVVSSSGRGANGPVHISENTKLRTTIGRDFIDALNTAGYKPIKDSAMPEEGYGRPQFMIKNGKRISTASVYLRPAMYRSNLHVVTRAKVNKITFNYNDEEKRAAGVEYEFHGSKHRVLTNREIILSAGTIGSPAILLSSGIGPKEYYGEEPVDILHSSGEQILIQESPQVGKNLKDHVAFVLRYSINQPAGLEAKDMFSLTGLVKSVFEYYLHGSGNLAYPLIEYVGFLNSKSLASTVEKDGSIKKSISSAAPDVQFYFSPVDVLALNILNMTNFIAIPPPQNSEQQNSKESEDHPGQNSEHVFSLGFVLLKPQSSGKVSLMMNTNVNDEKPSLSVDPKYFSDNSDFDVLSSSVKYLHKLLVDSASLAKYDLKILDSISETDFAKFCSSDNGSVGKLHDDDALIDCLIRNRPLTAYHPTGTCRMGSKIEQGVVDAQLKVHGVNGLRVVDASIFPEPVSSNPCASVIMVAEKASDLIKNDANQFSR